MRRSPSLRVRCGRSSRSSVVRVFVQDAAECFWRDPGLSCDRRFFVQVIAAWFFTACRRRSRHRSFMMFDHPERVASRHAAVLFGDVHAMVADVDVELSWPLLVKAFAL